MSIIHDALKKIQQGISPKADEKQSTPPTKAPAPSAYIYNDPPKSETLTPPPEPQAKEQKPPVENRIKSVLALLCALAITLGAIIFLYKALLTYYPTAKRMVKTAYNQWLHKIQKTDSNPKPPEPLPPLAKITVNTTASTAPVAVPVTSPNPAAPADLPSTANTQAIPTTPQPQAPETLNVHGVMSNGKNNLVLINDQVYQEGDDIDGVKIVKIDLDYITINNNGKEEKIRVKN